MEPRKNNNVMAEVDVSTIAKPSRIPNDWVVNPHNNPDVESIGKVINGQKWIPHIRENWISPQALQKLCSKIGCDQTTHNRLPNSHYLEQKQSNIMSKSLLLQ